MRALIIDSVSRETVISPCSTWLTNSFIRLLPRSRAAGSLPKRPCSTIWSSRPPPTCCSTVCVAAADFSFSGIGLSLGLHFFLQLAQLVGVVDRILQQFLELVVALQAAAQVRKLRPQLQQFPQRPYLAGYLLRLEILQALEVQVHLQLPAVGVVAQLVLHRKRNVGLHSSQHAIKVVRVDLDKFPVLQPRHGLSGLPGKISQHPHHKRQFL